MMHKGIRQTAELQQLIRPYLQFTTAALLSLGLLGGWAGTNWPTVLIIFGVMIGSIIWIGRQAKLHEAKPMHMYASAGINLISSAVIVIITGGAYSPFWLLFVIGAVSSALSFRGSAGVNLERLNAGIAALALMGPELMGWPPDRAVIALASMQVFTLFMSSTIIRKITTSILGSEERYRTLIDTARDVIFTIAPNGQLTSLNQSFETFTGWSRPEWLGRPFEELIFEEDRAPARDWFKRILIGETLHSNRVRVYTRAGGVLVVEVNLSPETLAGHLVGLLGIARDMTEEQHAEDALEASERRFRALIENGWDAFTLTDAQGTILYASPSTVRLLGYALEEFVGLNAFTLFHPDDLKLASSKLAEVLAAPGKVVTAQVRIRHNDGSWRWVEGVATNLLSEPDVQALVTNYHDVTERKQAEKEIHRHAETMTALYETTRDLIIESDLPKLFQTIIERATRLLNAAGGGLYLSEPENNRVRCVVSYNTPRDYTGTLLKYGEGAAGIVAQSGEPLIVDDYSTWEGRAKIYEQEKPFSAVLSVPMKWQDEVIGVIHVLEFNTERYFTEDDLKLVTSFANQAAIALQNAHLHTNLQQRNRILSALQETTFALMGQLELSEVLQAIITKAAQLMDTPHGYIYVVEHGEEAIQMILGVGIYAQYMGQKLSPDEGLAGKVWKTAQPLNVPDYHTWDGRSARFDDTGFHAVVGVPLTAGSKVTGVLGLAHLETDRTFSNDDADLLNRFAQLASIALENARLYTLGSQELAERKMADEALSESRAQLSGIIESAMDAIITLDPDQRIILFNNAAEKMFECLATEVIGQPIDRFIPAQFRDAHREHINRFGQTGITARSMRMLGALTGLRCDGSEFPIEASISQLNANGQKLYSVIVRDITERVKAEEDLRAAETRYRTLVEQLPIVIYISPASDICSTTYISPQIKAFLGYSQGEWLKDPRFWSKALHPEDRSRVLAQFEHVNRTGESPDMEYRMIAKDGSIVWIREQATLLRDTDGNPLLWQGLIIDITEQKRADEQIKRQIDHLKALRVIDMAITSSTDLHLSLQIILKQAVVQLQIDAADILLLNSVIQTLEYAEGIGFRTKGIERSSVRLGEAYTGWAVLERRMITIHDLQDKGVNFPRNSLIEGENFTSYFAVPLIVKGEVKGILEIFHRQPIEPDQEWLDFLEALAGQTALAIDNATLFERLQRSHIELSLAYETTLEGWSAALDLRDKETEGHTQRVVDLTLRLAEHMGVKDKDLTHIRRGALLHDIGKMGVPDRILLKPDDLTFEERKIMQLHPVYAYEMLSRIEYLHPALGIPYCHHEKWNGTGYPQGLKGEEIPLEARMFAVVDVYDAITSDRPYRPAWKEEEALEHIRRLAGEDFDPKVVEAFLELLEQG